MSVNYQAKAPSASQHDYGLVHNIVMINLFECVQFVVKSERAHKEVTSTMV